mgnify:CR=1 FL=1
MGYCQNQGGRWNKDYLVADQEELSQMYHSGQTTADVHVRRVKEVHPLKTDGAFVFALRAGTLAQPRSLSTEGDFRQDHRTGSNPFVEDPGATPLYEDDEEPIAEGSFEHDPAAIRDAVQDELVDEDEEKDYWYVVKDNLIRVHRKFRTKLFIPSEVDDCPIPLKFVDVIRKTFTSIEGGKVHS